MRIGRLFTIILFFSLLNGCSVWADTQNDISAKQAVSIIKDYEKAYMNRDLNKMLEYVDQSSDWFKEGFIDEFKAIFKSFTNINFYHFKYSKDKAMYYAYPAEGGIFVGQNTLYIAYSRSFSDLNEFTEVYSLKEVGDTYKIDIIRHMPGNDVEFIDKGTGAMLENKVDEAISYFKKAMESNPENSVAYCRLGMIYAKTGKPKEAIEFLKKATELRSNVGFYRFYLSQVYFMLGDKEKASNEMEKALMLDPGLEIFFGEKTTTYINKDIGIKIIGPPQWYMYVAEEIAKVDEPLRELLGESYKENSGDSDKVPIQTKVVEFCKYPFGKVLPNPNIILSFFDSFGAPEELKTPMGYMNYSVAKAQKVAQEFKILKGPEKIFINGKEASIATVEFVVPIAGISKRFKQIHCICFNNNFIVEIIATDTSENFDVNEKIFSDCIRSLVIFDMGIIATNSELYRAATGGFIFRPGKKKATYLLLLEPKKAIKDSYYLEIEFENPDDINKPILTSSEVTDLIKIYSGKKYLALESPDLASLKPFKAYEARVKTYESKDKRKLIDTFAQKIISFYYF